MIKVIETMYLPNQEPVSHEKEYSYSKNKFLKLFEENVVISGEELYHLKKTGEVFFTSAGIKRKIEIKEDPIEVADSLPESVEP